MEVKRWWPYAVGGAVGAAAAAWGVIALGGGTDAGTLGANPGSSPSASAIPAITATQVPVVEPSPPVAGAIPAPAFPASAIPWTEVGPGWFLLAYDPNTKDDTEVVIGTYESEYEDGTWTYKVPNADEALMLVSPAGGIYQVTSLAGMGPVRAGIWRGTSLDLFQPTSDVEGIASSLDLASGIAAETRRGSGQFPTEMTAGGRAIGEVWDYESLAYVGVYGADGSLIRKVGTEASGCSTLAPDGRSIVCLESRPDNRADVVLYDVDAGTRTPLDIFKLSAWDYSLLGWWDPTSFLVMRWGDDGPLYWAYDVGAKKLREVNPSLPDGSQASTVEGLGNYHRLGGEGSDFIYGADGALRAQLPCELAGLGGDTALTLCGVLGDPDRVTISVTNLVTGDARVVVEYPSAIDDSVTVFRYPGTPAVQWYDHLLFH